MPTNNNTNCYLEFPLYFLSFQEIVNRMNERIFSVLLLASVTLLLEIQLTSSCNQMLCASAVSKCMLTQQCKCDIKTCSCCDDCVNCLSWLWKECCSCVDLCPKPNETRVNPLSKQSHSETLEDHIPGLFSALIEDSDEEKWSVFTFPVDFDVQTMSHSQKNFLRKSFHNKYLLVIILMSLFNS